jgi:hypothetical protein
VSGEKADARLVHERARPGTSSLIFEYMEERMTSVTNVPDIG